MRLLPLSLLVAGCSMPPEGLWPSPTGEPTLEVVISSDSWHSMIAIPRPEGGYEEWGYAEKKWYLEGKQGLFGVIRALFWPTQGIVEIATVDAPYAARAEGGRRWTFDFGPESVRRLRAYLELSLHTRVIVRDDGWRRWYDAAWDYHLFHTCHHYVANGLWEAGVPMEPWRCLLPGGLWDQMAWLGRRP